MYIANRNQHSYFQISTNDGTKRGLTVLKLSRNPTGFYSCWMPSITQSYFLLKKPSIPLAKRKRLQKLFITAPKNNSRYLYFRFILHVDFRISAP